MDNLFFWASKLIWLFISPGSWVLLSVIAAWLAFAVGWHRLGRRLVSSAALLVLVIGFLPVGEWLIAPLENRYTANPTLPERVDGIIVLSGAIDPYRSSLWQQTELGSAAERLLSFMDLAKRYPEARLVFSGGIGSMLDQAYSAAFEARNLFSRLTDLDQRVEYERQSRNTFENVTHSQAMIDPRRTENWVVITSAFHMPRTMGIFCGQNWAVIPYPVDHYAEKGNLLRIDFDFTNNLQILSIAVREWVGLLAYRVTGKTLGSCPASN